MLFFEQMDPFLRFILSGLTAFCVILSVGQRVIDFLRVKQGKGQPIRVDGPQSHLEKKGTPTMGGFLLLLGIGAGCLAWGDWSAPFLWIVLGMTFGYAGIGFIDDYRKVTKRSSAGLSGYIRLGLETLLAAIAVGLISYLTPGIEATTIVFPFQAEWQLNVGWLYYFFAVFVIVGSANALNITDGLDGLATKTSLFPLIFLVVMAALVADFESAYQFVLPYLPQNEAIVVYGGAVLGSLMGFLWFNTSPAKIWMGDLGSLALGGGLATMAVMSKSELFWGIAAGLFVLEILSVIIQVRYFKMTKGKRIFKMAPIHHHFELVGWKETTVVDRFFLISILFTVLAVLAFWVRL